MKALVIIMLMAISILLGIFIASEVIIRYMPTRTAYVEFTIDKTKPFVLDRNTCKELSWMSTDPCWDLK